MALGVATTRLEERLLASLGKLEVAPVCFEAVQDVPSGGVLCALPALLFWGETRWLVTACVVFCAGYLLLYRQMLKGKAPV